MAFKSVVCELEANTPTKKHKFDVLLEKVDETKRQQLEAGLDNNLNKIGGEQ